VRSRTVALLLAAVLAFYLVTLGRRGVLLVADGRGVAVGLGLGLLVLPVLGAWAVARELAFGWSTQRLAVELELRGGLPPDDLPRCPSGRVDRAEAEVSPEDWAAWFRLSCAYDVAGDRRRARAAMRHAVALHGDRSTSEG